MPFPLSRRDCLIALAAASVTGCVFALAPTASAVLGASTYSWADMKAHKTPQGEMRPVVTGPTATLERLEIHITTLNPGQASHPPHHHANEELILVNQGTVETLSNAKWVRLQPGSVIFNSSESWHSIRNVGTEPARFFVVNWRTPATDAIAAKNPPDGMTNPPANLLH